MAYLPDDPNTQSQNQAPAGQNSMASQAPITSSPAPAGGGTAGKTMNQASSSAPAQPFTNLQSYLTANAPQIQQQGQQISGNLNDQYNAATGAIDQAKNGFNSQVDSGYTHNDPQVVNNFSANPSAVAADPNAAKTFTGMYGDKYTGPSSFETSAPYGAVNDQVNKGVSLASQVSTPGGVQAYLMGQNPNETHGMATLDSSLIGANPDVVSSVNNAAARYQNLPSYLSDAVTSADAGVTTAQQQAQAAKAAAQGAMGTAVTNLNTGVQGEMTAAQKSAQDYNTAVQQQQQEIADTTRLLNQFPDLLAHYGASVNGTPYPTAPTSFTQRNITPLSMTPANVASSGDYATAAALKALSGGGVTLPIDQSTASQAGTYKTPTTPSNSDLNSAIQAAQQWAAQANPTINIASSGNVQPFANAANDWYSQLIAELNAVNNTPPSGFNTGPKSGPFSAGPTNPGVPGGV